MKSKYGNRKIIKLKVSTGARDVNEAADLKQFLCCLNFFVCISIDVDFELAI